MNLPGGTWDRNFKVSNTFEFAPVTGQMELDLAETLPKMNSAAAQVTTVLATVLSRLGERPADHQQIHTRLSIGDRQFLMRLAAKHLGAASCWHAARCLHCRRLFDLEVDETALPVEPAQDSYPLATALTSQGKVTVKAPTGDDLDRAGPDRTRLGKQLVVDASPGVKRRLTAEDIRAVEQSAKTLCPKVTRQIQTCCPECGRNNVVELDPYGAISRLARTGIMVEIDRIARAYHWSEAEILSLPAHRRQAYLDLIDKHSGMAH